MTGADGNEYATLPNGNLLRLHKSTSPDPVGDLARFFEMMPGDMGEGQQWTTTPPSETGHFWAYHKRGILIMPNPVMIHMIGQLSADSVTAVIDPRRGYKLGDFSHFLGPLPVPDSPKD